ncbi:MAG TPA: phosphoribosylanthranilate isomerase [Pyrinomonadaceae bacterium]|nr:phosphoribosylanthranilate isomerase [Pyrinomonadaceae bacterium]
MAKIKICGITTLGDALACAAAGADALGFNFYRGSQRYVHPERVREITRQLPPEILTVGVFVDEPSPEVIRYVADVANVTAVQLHGDESPEYCTALTNKFVIKVVHPNKDHRELTQYKTSALMVDTFDEHERGGTGRLSDWSFARKLIQLTPRLFLAGGLSPENVADAVKIVEPYAVDACSALESSPGKKDPDRVRAFVEAVRRVKR